MVDHHALVEADVEVDPQAGVARGLGEALDEPGRPVVGREIRYAGRQSGAPPQRGGLGEHGAEPLGPAQGRVQGGESPEALSGDDGSGRVGRQGPVSGRPGQHLVGEEREERVAGGEVLPARAQVDRVGGEDDRRGHGAVGDEGVQGVLEGERAEPHVAVAQDDHGTVGPRALWGQIRPEPALGAERARGQAVPLQAAARYARAPIGPGLRGRAGKGEEGAVRKAPPRLDPVGVEGVLGGVRRQGAQPELLGLGGRGDVSGREVGGDAVGAAVVGAQPVGAVPDVRAGQSREEGVGEAVAVGEAVGQEQDLPGRAVAAPQEGDGAEPGLAVDLLDERGAATPVDVPPERVQEGGQFGFTGGGHAGGEGLERGARARRGEEVGARLGPARRAGLGELPLAYAMFIASTDVIAYVTTPPRAVPVPQTALVPHAPPPSGPHGPCGLRRRAASGSRSGAHRHHPFRSRPPRPQRQLSLA